MKLQLNKGQTALIDNKDFSLVKDSKWYVSSNGYVVKNESIAKGKYKTVLLHRFLLNIPKGLTGDHINRDKLDNRRSNLRIVTQGINNLNHRIRTDNTSGYAGVSFNKQYKKWQSRIEIEGETLFLGVFDNPLDASNTYEDVKRRYLP